MLELLDFFLKELENKGRNINRKGWFNMNVEFKKENNALVVKLQGEIDSESAKFLRRSIDIEYDEVGAKDMIFDMRDVGFMDSSGIGLIIGRYKRVSALRGKIKIFGCDSTVKRIIDLSGLGKIVTVCKTEEEAVGRGMKND